MIDQIIFISAKQNQHTGSVKRKNGRYCIKRKGPDRKYHYYQCTALSCIERSGKILSDIKAGLDNKLPGDLLALDIRRCLHYLGEITGEMSNEDMLDYIFSKFCIGK